MALLPGLDQELTIVPEEERVNQPAWIKQATKADFTKELREAARKIK